MLTEGSVFAKLCQQTKNDFLISSIKIVSRWYDTYKESEESPSASVFIALYEEDTQLYLALLKVNFQEGYTNIIENDDDGKRIRPYSAREWARLQGFPDWFKFYGNDNDSYRQVGNAVPVDMARWIGKQLVRYFS